MTAILELLADARRRHVLERLVAEGCSTRRELAAAIAAKEIGDRPDDVPEEEIQRVALHLHHVHLPKIADTGLVEYDGRSGDVLLVENQSELEELLALLSRADESTPPMELADDLLP